MHIEVKENRIIIEFGEEEMRFIEQKAGDSEIENVSKYIRGKLIKALSLDDLEKPLPNVGKDFNLNKIKKVTDELKKSKDKSGKVVAPSDNPSIEKAHKGLEQNEISEEIEAEIGDELLAGLLDKDLLKGRKKQKEDSES